MECYQRALALNSQFPQVLNNLGTVLLDLKRPSDALPIYLQALEIKPEYPEALYNSANALTSLGRFGEALRNYKASLIVAPTNPLPLLNLGNLLRYLGRLEEANFHYHRSLLCSADQADVLCNLAGAEREQGKLFLSAAKARLAIVAKPNLAQGYAVLGQTQSELGEHDNAVLQHERALLIRPDLVEAHSSMLVTMHYQPQRSAVEFLDKARQYAAKFEPFRLRLPQFVSDDPQRRLRIGYVSGDFHRHPVGYFLAPVIGSHDKQGFEIFCYSNSPIQDDLTATLRASADQWREIFGLTDEQAKELIEKDKIDILVDLSGHTARNRLILFALRAAPLQISWLGYWATTGLSAIDYIVSDALTIPTGDERWYSEKVRLLPANRLCYAPPSYAPPPIRLPSFAGSGITFGCFNNLAKLGQDAVQCWASILTAIPDSRLLLKWKSLSDEGMRERITQSFAKFGVSAQKLELRGASAHPDLLASYSEVDVALDPFPFSGGVTSCEALWMGVPVVTLPKEYAISRQTAGILQALGNPEWIARDEADYQRIALELASDPVKRASVRATLRSRMAASKLCDGATFARQLEEVIRSIWRNYCGDSPMPSIDA
jgi:predicted O-linked N-acetylglucosamine transferase (SPINDLY family)